MKVGIVKVGVRKERALHAGNTTHVYLKENKDWHGEAWHGNANKSPLATKVFLLTLKKQYERQGGMGEVIEKKHTTPIIPFLLPFPF